jgi:hypothetical protein
MEDNMRALVVSSFAAFLMVPVAAMAWSADQAPAQATNGANFADPDHRLEDMVKNNSQTKSGFYISGGVSDPTGNAGLANPLDRVSPTPYGYSASPIFQPRR